MTAVLTIRPIAAIELPLLRDFAPPEWNTDLSKTFSFHFGQPYFYPVVAELDGKVVGCANALLQGQVGWLGNIIVLPEFRGSSLGLALTSHLVGYFHIHGCRSQLLIATRMGERLYKKLGFQICGSYIFLHSDQTPKFDCSRRIRSLQPADVPAVMELDRRASGEERGPFLSRFLEGGYVYQSSMGDIAGYLLPDLGNGLIIARVKRAGLALLKFKLSYGSPNIVLPTDNLAALDLVRRAGYQETNRAPRMWLGEPVDWKPEMIFSRGAGYCG